MKKLFTLLIIAFTGFQSNATTHTVLVSNFQFSPANLNVVVGDIIRWQWSSGFHTTTSLTVPVAATSWNSPFLSASGDFYDYTVTVQGTYNYYCDIHGLGMSGSFTASPVIPVTLAVFNVNNRGNNPYLSWTTVTETNADYFSVRRSYDGVNFSEISRIPAAGNSSIEQNYAYTDVGLKKDSRFVYYVLAMTDKDGSVQLSPIKVLKSNIGIKKIITSISPNPVSEAGHLMIKFNADATGTLLAQISDIAGKIVLVTELSATEGVNNGHIHLGDLGSGIYIIQFTLNGLTETYKIRKK